MSKSMMKRKAVLRNADAMPEVKAIASWYGSNRMLAHAVGEELAACNWVGVAFAGGMTELLHITARTLQVNDKHLHLINLATVMSDRVLGMKLYRSLRRRLFHPAELERAQDFCRRIDKSNAEDKTLFGAEQASQVGTGHPQTRIDWAEAYLICSWMARHSLAGTRNEFDAPLSTRWNAGGGDSSAHFRGIVKSLNAWRRVFQRANFTTLDFRKFLGKCKDEPGIGVYTDPPFPEVGDLYKHAFTIADHRDLAKRLTAYQFARVVARFYEHPLVAELYPEYPAGPWHYRRLEGRKQTNDAAPELLIMNGPSLAKVG